MRPRHQTGQIRRRGSNWILRYYEDRLENGKVIRVRTTKVLASYEQYPYKQSDEVRLRRELESQIRVFLDPVNRNGGENAEGTLPLGEFIEQRYFSAIYPRLPHPARNEH